MKKDKVIFDLDGTLALIDDRRAYSTLPNGKMDWKRFFDPKNILMDKPNGAVIEMAKLLKQAGYKVFIFSGRSAATRTATEVWLDHHGVGYDTLVMRPTKKGLAHMPDDQLKQLWLDEHFPGEDKDRILCTYDDRQKVVDMWRRNGITCMQVDEGDF